MAYFSLETKQIKILFSVGYVKRDLFDRSTSLDLEKQVAAAHPGQVKKCCVKDRGKTVAHVHAATSTGIASGRSPPPHQLHYCIVRYPPFCNNLTYSAPWPATSDIYLIDTLNSNDVNGEAGMICGG